MTDKDMILNPEEWPRWPLLPLKHKTRQAHEPNWVGFLIVSQPMPPYRVHAGSIYRIDNLKDADQLPVETFDSVDALLKEWRID